jgi:hypothetical protein
VATSQAAVALSQLAQSPSRSLHAPLETIMTSTHSQFHSFERLPTELRLMIWTYALPGCRIIEFARRDPKNLSIDYDYRSEDDKSSWITNTSSPSHLYVNREARKLALISYEKSLCWSMGEKAWRIFYVNYDKDIFYLRGVSMSSIGPVRPRYFPTRPAYPIIPARTRHLAIPASWVAPIYIPEQDEERSSRHYNCAAMSLRMLLQAFENLEQLTLGISWEKKESTDLLELRDVKEHDRCYNKGCTHLTKSREEFLNILPNRIQDAASCGLKSPLPAVQVKWIVNHRDHEGHIADCDRRIECFQDRCSTELAH